MSALEDALTIPRAALALIPPPETPPSALLSGAFNLSFSPSLIAAPSPSSIWSNESQNLNIQLLLKVELFSVKFYRDLELSASEAWDNGARSLANLHPNIRLPIWYIPFAAKLVQVLSFQQRWCDAWLFSQTLVDELPPPHLSHVIPAALKLFDTVGYDMKITGALRTSDLPVLFSRSKIAGPFIDAFAATLSAQLHALDIPVTDIYLGSTQIMDWMQYEDAEWENFEQSKQLTAVRTSICRQRPLLMTQIRPVNLFLASRMVNFVFFLYRASFNT
jgi:hypothetical protein